jgi:hypothetical protein
MNMDWAMVTWGILIGMVGLLWVMALAVMQEDADRKARRTPPEPSESEASEHSPAPEARRGYLSTG